MAEIDARIPLMVQQPQFMKPQDLMALKTMQYRNELYGMQMQQAQQEVQSRNALTGLLKQPGAIDETTGMPTKSTVGKVWQVDPKAGMELQNNLALYQQRQEEMKTQHLQQTMAKLKISGDQTTVLQNISTGLQSEYEKLVANGTPDQQARQLVTAQKIKAIQQAVKGGQLLPDQAANMQGAFDPEWNKIFIQGAPAYIEMQKEKHQENTEKLAANRENRLTDASERTARAQERRADAEGETPFMKEAAALYGKGTPEYKKAIRDHVVKTTGTGGMGGRESVYNQRIMMSAGEAARDLENVARLPVTTSSGWFGGHKQGPGILDATRSVLANKATSQDVQIYNTMASGFQRTLATIEAAGLAPSGALTHQMDGVMLKEGDTELTKLSKLAQIRQIMEAAIDVSLSNPRVSNSEKQKMQQIVAQVKKAVPFTQEDVIKLMSSKSDKVTLQQLMRQKKSTSGIPTGSPSASKSTQSQRLYVGKIDSGYRYKGGNPKSLSSWEKVK